MSIPRLETERLIIRELTPADADARRQISEEGFATTVTTQDNESWLHWTLLNYRELDKLYQPPYGDRAVVLKESGHVIGLVGLVPSLVPWGVFDEYRPPGTPPDFLVSPEFGLFWVISAAQRGSGYAAEAARPVIDYVFKRLYARRIVATTEHANLASQRVMSKLGMKLLHNPGDKPFWFEVVGVLENRS